MAIASRQELIDYCLRHLGAPVIEINVDDDQVSDRIDEALQLYQEYSTDAIEDNYFKHQITADDVTNGYISLPEPLTVVKRVVNLTNGTGSGGMFNAQYQMALNDVYMLRGFNMGTGVASYAQTMSYMQLVNDMFNSLQQSRFNRHSNRLYLIDTTLAEGEWIVIDGSMILDPEIHTDIYNDILLKKLSTSFIKRQWGQNMSKFEGMQLPGGVTMNGRQMLEDANTEIAAIEEELQLRYEDPADFFIG